MTRDACATPGLARLGRAVDSIYERIAIRGVLRQRRGQAAMRPRAKACDPARAPPKITSASSRQDPA